MLFVGLFFSFNIVNTLSLLLWIGQQLILLCIILASGTSHSAILSWFRKVLKLEMQNYFKGEDSILS